MNKIREEYWKYRIRFAIMFREYIDNNPEYSCKGKRFIISSFAVH